MLAHRAGIAFERPYSDPLTPLLPAPSVLSWTGSWRRPSLQVKPTTPVRPPLRTLICEEDQPRSLPGPAGSGRDATSRDQSASVRERATDRARRPEIRPRTPPTRMVSHFARNQPSKARPSSASPPSPALRSLTGVRLVLLLQIRIRIRASRGPATQSRVHAGHRGDFSFFGGDLRWTQLFGPFSASAKRDLLGSGSSFYFNAGSGSSQ